MAKHPRSEGKIERRHQTLKNRMLLEYRFLPWALEKATSSTTTTIAATTSASATDRWQTSENSPCVPHTTGRWSSNRLEIRHLPLRRRERAML